MLLIFAFIFSLTNSPVVNYFSSSKISVEAGIVPLSSSELKMESHILQYANNTLTLQAREQSQLSQLAWHQIESARFVEGNTKITFFNSKKQYLVLYTPTVKWVLSFKNNEDLVWFTALLKNYQINIEL